MAAFLSLRLVWQLSGSALRQMKGRKFSCVARCLSLTRAIEPVQQYSAQFHCASCLSHLNHLNNVFCSRSIATTAVFFDEVTVECPAFAESVTEGDIRWTKTVGESVSVDDVVAEIETDKTTVEVMATHAGIITNILAEDGTAVRPKQQLCVINTDADAAAAASPVPDTPPASPTESQVASPSPPPPSPPPIPHSPPPIPQQEQIPVDSPIPTTIPPIPPLPKSPMSSTPVSEIKINQPLPVAVSDIVSRSSRSEQRVKMSRMRLRIAQRLKESQNTCAMLTTFNEVDMSTLITLREKYKDKFLKEHGIKLGFMSAFIKASAYALEAEPSVNAVIDDTDIVYRDYVDISVAVATPKGLLVPVLRNVEQMNYTDIEKTISELGEKARTGSLAIEDMDGGTFTVSNGGVFGSMFGTPIINPPQSAILGMHGIFDRPVAVSGKVEIRPMMYIALTYDHRLIDGREAVLFLRRIKSAVEDPAIMLLDL